MKIRVSPSELNGDISIPSSKSYLHRLLIASALCRNGDSTDILYSGALCDDIKYTIKSLESLGASISFSKDYMNVKPIKTVSDNPVLDCGNSASSLRFLLPVFAALTDNFSVKGSEALSKRPISALTDALEMNGLQFSSSYLPFGVSGHLQSGQFILSGDISSQFFSGLLFALPLLKNCGSIISASPVQSENYLEITRHILSQFKVESEIKDSGFFIKGNQTFISPKTSECEADWSSASFWLCTAAINGNISINNLKLHSLQPDAVLIKILGTVGADISCSDDKITVSRNTLKRFEFSAEHSPDLVPILSVLASACDGTSIIKNVGRLKYKESNRIDSTIALLKSMGIYSYTDNNNLIINGNFNTFIADENINGYNDHRIAMSAIVAACNAVNSYNIDSIESISKSYPDFLSDYKKLGGIFNVI